MPSTLWVSVFCWVSFLQVHLALLSTPWAIQQVPSVKKFEQLLLWKICDLENRSNCWQMHNNYVCNTGTGTWRLRPGKGLYYNFFCHLYSYRKYPLHPPRRRLCKLQWEERFQKPKLVKLDWNNISFCLLHDNLTRKHHKLSRMENVAASSWLNSP